MRGGFVPLSKEIMTMKWGREELLLKNNTTGLFSTFV
ncbi:MAG: hypothetical protein ACI8P3_002547 [Saprospiraceae bacterium]|jgi:hypothetical protein